LQGRHSRIDSANGRKIAAALCGFGQLHPVLTRGPWMLANGHMGSSVHPKDVFCAGIFLASPDPPGAPIPKFASLGDILWCELRNPEVH
jgi:hypothetical protein